MTTTKRLSITERISKINQYLFLLGAMLLLSIAGKEIYKDITRAGYEPPKIALVETTSENKVVDINYSKLFKRKINDVYVFSIKSDKIVQPDLGENDSTEIVNMFSGSTQNDMMTVNLLFAREQQRPTLLFEHHTVITDYFLYEDAPDTYQYALAKNGYLIVDDDTNQDGYLSSDDHQNFYTSNYDGSALTLILSNVDSMAVENDNLVHLKQGTGVDAIIYFYQVDIGKLIKLDTNLSETVAKSR